MRFSVLASGSSGNASLLESGGVGVLVDAGLGPRQLQARLEDVGGSWEQLHAVLLTHVHGDHWNERTFIHLERRGIRVYCHLEHGRRLTAVSPAFASLRKADLVRRYEPGTEFHLTHSLRCRAIPLQHDGGATCGFRFEGGLGFFGPAWSLAYATDLGTWQPDLAQAFANVDVLALEFNHDVRLQLSSGRSPQLIARVLGDEGHLSNEQAAGLVREIVRGSEPGKLRHVVQLHLSRDCNRPSLARAAAQAALAPSLTARISIGRQFRAGPCLKIGTARVRARRPRPLCATMSHQPCFPGW